jgi:general secretion pathway protein J
MDGSDRNGFTLVELVVAMTVMSMIAVSIYGVFTLGANATDSGERKTEQARRYRLATSLVVRQLRSTVPLMVQFDDEMEESRPQPYFFGQRDHVEFITAVPQRPDASGLAAIRYWYEDGAFMMAEMPLFATAFQDPFGPGAEELTFTTTLLYDVRSLEFSYRRTSHDSENWSDEWDAAEEDSLPAVVSIKVESDGSPSWFHEVPLFVGVLNEISGEDDFQVRKAGKATRMKKAVEKKVEEKAAADDDDDDWDDWDDDDDE